MRRKGSICLYVHVLGPETVRRKGSICLYVHVLGPETVRRKGSICLYMYWDLRLCEGKVLSTRKKVTFHDARQVADMCIMHISYKIKFEISCVIIGGLILAT